MSINRISGLSHKLPELSRLWQDYGNYWYHKDAATSAASVPTLRPAPTPSEWNWIKQKRGAKWFASVVRRPSFNKKANIARGRLEEDDQGGIPAWIGIGHDQYKAIEAIPGNNPAERPVQTEKPRTTLFVEPRHALSQLGVLQAQGAPMAEHQQSAGKKLADRQRVTFLRIVATALLDFAPHGVNRASGIAA